MTFVPFDDIRSAFLDWGLYAPFDLPPMLESPAESEEGWRYILDIECFSNTLDTYCCWCRRDSVFHCESNSTEKRTKPWALRPRVFVVEFYCSRDSDHLLLYYFRVGDRQFAKIGQYPSLADIHIGQLKDYSRVLSANQRTELTKGIGLFAHGIGIGAFVYLRRLFEQLVEAAHVEALARPKWNEAKYQKSRTAERIVLLKDYLPEFLVQNRSVYGILSKGLHELSEMECKQHFAAVRSAIELVLEEKLDKLRRDEKIAATRNAIAKIGGNLKKQAKENA